MSAALQLVTSPTITRFNSLRDTRAQLDLTSWPELFSEFSKVTAFRGVDHPGFSAASFDPPQRLLANVKDISALVLDYDNKAKNGERVAVPVTLDQMAAELANYYGQIHSTRSHTVDWPRFRVILPLSRKVSAAEYSTLWQVAARRWPGLDPSPKDPSRFWFLPGVGSHDGACFESRDLTGAFLDPDQLLPAAQLAKPVKTTRSNDERRARAYIAKMPAAISGAGGHDALWDVARKLCCDFGLAEASALTILKDDYNPRCEPAWSERELQHKVKQALTKATVSNPVEDRAYDALAIPEPEVFEPEVESYAEQLPAFTRGYKCTDLGNGERMVAMFHGTIRYNYERERWLKWDGKRWLWDFQGQINQCAKLVARSIYHEAAVCVDKSLRAGIDTHAKNTEKRAAQSAMIAAACSEPGVPVLLADLDRNAWLLNCANGTIDLKTAALKPHDKRDLITKTTGINYDPAATSELWDRVLEQATGGDAELAAYTQRMIGYALIGESLERVFFFLFGPGGTAKTTLINAFMAALGEYAVTADFETWLLRNNPGGNRGDLVRLAGARLVTSVEGRHGARWDESLVKRITGGDAITVAAKFENEVSFTPCCTLLLAANDAPSARDDDGALWERMKRIPLTAVIPFDQRDRTIKERLKEPEHATAVLAWAVAGCLEYQRVGLGSAKVVEESTREYHAENDHFGEFLADQFVMEAGERVERKTLNLRYDTWCGETGRKSRLSTKEMAKRLRAAGCSDKKIMGARMWEGVRLADSV